MNNKTFDASFEFDPFVDDVHFMGCTFDGTDLRNVQFDGCTFEECTFNNARLLNVSFQDCEFTRCYLQGVDMTLIKGLMLSFRMENCNVRYSNWTRMNLSNCAFHQCDFKGADLSEITMKNTELTYCDMSSVIWDAANLSGTDMEGSQITMNPNGMILEGTKFSLEQLPGLLTQTGIQIV
ncbi:MAG: hypothetical protein RL754_1091 [Bacteroidota bacterium]|jgi:uncharacterized protein YjbI with pentapeptide repeats